LRTVIVEPVSEEATPMAIAPGENVGVYRVMTQLGSGGMATVFRAYHPSLDRYVAIKVLHPALKQDPQFFERFKREARIVANLEHPSIIPVYDFSDHHGEPYLVMRFIEGDTLKGKMDASPMPAADILKIMRPICQALDYAHKQGVLHRDIKPSNIMVSTDGTVLLTDFGLARMVQAGESTLSQDMMVGTPQYISPEQAQGESQLDGRTDIYSLGVVLYEMLTGRVPFNADTPFATVHDHIYTPLPLPSDINPKISPDVERLLLKALAKDPSDRYTTADDLLRALETTLYPTAPNAATAPRTTGVPGWVWAGGIILVLCVLGGLLVGTLALRSRNQATLVDDGPASGPADSAATPVVDQPPPATGGSYPPHTQVARALTQQATEAIQQREPEQAVALYQEAINADSHYLPAYIGLSRIFNQMGDKESSTATLQDAVRNNPDSVIAWAALGQNQLFVRGDPEAALLAFDEAAVLQPDSAIPHAGQALALTALDRTEEAKQAIDTALALEPDSPEAHLANAYYLKEQGRRVAALRELREIAQNDEISLIVREQARQLLQQLGE
jgi:serine/threonine protein kinase/Flp pilus assembly protein TadD